MRPIIVGNLVGRLIFRVTVIKNELKQSVNDLKVVNLSEERQKPTGITILYQEFMIYNSTSPDLVLKVSSIVIK